MAINPISSSGVFSIIRQINLQSALAARAAERLASGLRINSAGDDPSGITRVGRFLAQISGFNAAASNVQTGVSMVQSAEAGLQSIKDLIADIEDLAIQAQNGALTSTEVAAIQDQVEELWQGVQDIIQTTSFNGQDLLAGDSFTLQTGPNAGQTVTITTPDVDTLLSTLDSRVTTFITTNPADSAAIQTAAANLETEAESGFNTIGLEVSKMGAFENRLTAQFNVLSSMSVATNSALSFLRDADTAAETVELAKAQLRVQSGLAMLAQFNVQNEALLKLLD